LEEKRLGELLTQQFAELESTHQVTRPVALLPSNMGLDSKIFAAWTTLARVLMNLDEFITRE
jgi:hypothetical protein